MGGQRERQRGREAKVVVVGNCCNPKAQPANIGGALGLWLIQLPPDVTVRGVAQGGEAAEGGGTEGWACSVDSERSSAEAF